MAGIIKADRWLETPHATQGVAFNLEDISQRADDCLVKVRQQAEQIIAAARRQAEQQAEAIAQEARERGREQALQEAQEQLRATLDQQLATLLPALEQAVQDIHHSKASWLMHWERQTLQLAAAIAARITRREVRQRPEITLDLVREALELVMGAGHVTVHLCPEDFEALRDRARSITEQLRGVATANIVADPDVTPGGCRVVTEFGEIDQRFESQLARIEQELS